MWLRSLALGVLVGVAAGCGSAEAPPPPPVRNQAPPPDAPFAHEQAGIQFSVPGGWRSHSDAGRMTFASPDGSLTVVLFTAADEHMEAVADEVDRQIGSVVANPVVEGGLDEGEINGIPVLGQKGTGEIGGKPIEWTVKLYEARQHVLVLSFGTPGAFDRYYPELDRFQHSFKKAT